MAFLYYLLHLPVLPAWALLIFAPQAALTRQYVHSGVIPLILGAAYAVLLFCGAVLGFAAPGAGMGSLAGVMALFSHPVGTLTGWAHFLVFDLFVGAWIARDAQALGLRHAGTVPVLLLALVFGPLGLFAHVLRRLWTGKGWQFG
ncbi:DUF4281 domain-containing protein [Cereibacter sphaeroides]|nr:DUF4281 domain-containing protein [Cereibacter sphaeroides]